jgi:hypothetical protein
MKRTAEQEAAYQQLYDACKKRLTQVSLNSPEDLQYILEVLNQVGKQERSVPALAPQAEAA